MSKETTKMTVVIFADNKDGVSAEIDGGLKSMQEIVGGYIQGVPLGNGLWLVCNEEGMFFPDTLQSRYRMFGTFFICGSMDSDFSSAPNPEWVVDNVETLLRGVNRY